MGPMLCTVKWVKKSLLRWNHRLGRWTATNVQKTTKKNTKKNYIDELMYRNWTSLCTNFHLEIFICKIMNLHRLRNHLSLKCIVRIIGTSLPTMHSVWRHHVHSVAVLVLYSVISVSYFKYLMMASETPRVCAIFGCKFIPGVKKCYHSFPKDAILINICVKKCRRSDGVNPNTASICSLNLFTPWNMFSSIYLPP